MPADLRASHGRARFPAFLRWFAALFAVVGVIVTAVLAVRAPDCIAVGVSILRAEDCTNRDTYYLLLAASTAATIVGCVLMLAAAHALELLAAIAARSNPADKEPRP